MDINAIIAAKKFGKGGGGSVPKPLTYDYMPEGYGRAKEIRTYAIDPIKVIEEVTPFNFNSGLSPYQVYNLGDIILEISGVQYQVSPVYDTSTGYAIASWGDASYAKVPGYVLSDGKAGSKTISISPDLLPATVSLYHSATETETFEERFIPFEPYHPMVISGDVEVISETTDTFSTVDAVRAYCGTRLLTIGKTYRVLWDGVEYTCIAKEVSWYDEIPGHWGGSGVYLGNKGLTGESEPFIVMGYTETGSGEYHFAFYIKAKTAGEHTVAIIGVDDSLSYAKMPSGYPTKTRSEDGDYQGVLGAYGAASGADVAHVNSNFEDDFYASVHYSVTYDGTEYHLPAWREYINGYTYYLVGNARLHPSLADYTYDFEVDDLPFLVAVSGTDNTCKVYFNDESTHNITVNKKYYSIAPMDKAFLPKIDYVADATGDTPTAAEFNALLKALRDGGYMY